MQYPLVVGAKIDVGGEVDAALEEKRAHHAYQCKPASAPEEQAVCHGAQGLSRRRQARCQASEEEIE